MGMRKRRAGALVASMLAVGAVGGGLVAAWPGGSSKAGPASRALAGDVTLTGHVPVTVASGKATLLHAHAANARIKLSFGFPIRNKAALEQLIAQQATTHRHLTREQLYARFSPTQAQVDDLSGWLTSQGFQITHVGADRLNLSATATTATVQRALHVTINDYQRPGFSFRGVDVKPYRFYSNTSDPKLPGRFGLETIAGLSDVDRFFTQAQLDHVDTTAPPGSRPQQGTVSDCDDEGGVINPLCVDVRGGGYIPADLKGLYDVNGHGIDGTGQTIGFTLWTAGERQATMTAYATATGDTPITVDPNCVASGNSPTVPSSCTTQTVAPDHLLFILENGNLDNNFGSNVETALDIEAAHGVANHVGMKYYAAECASVTPPGSGLTNAGCNGSDTGLLETMEDAANDPTLHSVSNSWAFGGEAEWGATDPFLVSSENILTLAAAAGTTFYFSTGDSGTYQSGYPSDSPHVVGVGGASTWSTSDPATWSTTTAWSGGGAWCSNVFSRPAWQTGAGVTAYAPCPGRVIPDVSAIADPNTGIRVISTTNTTGGTRTGQVGGTSLAAPVMNGLQALTQSFVAAQTYPGATPQVGFLAPSLYALGNGGHADSYYRDIECGNVANPTAGPDGDAAVKGWDAATGWGEPDWFNFATGVALQLGATNLSVPPSLSRHFAYTCAKTPSNSTERAFSCPTTNVCYAVGTASGATPWYGKFITGGAWGAVNTFFKSTNGGNTWFPSNSDMFSIACTSASTCIEVGAGGRERRTTDSGATWSDVATADGNNKPLTQVTCPSASTCYAVGDRGNAMKSTDGGQSWTWLNSTDGNPLYGLSCPSDSTCYATDIYAHVLKTSDGGASWTWQTTPVTTPGTNVPGSGGPNPFAGLMAISCSDASTCVASGLYVVPSGQTIPSTDPPIVTTTDGGANWVRQTSNAGSGAYLHAISCLPGTTTCTAVGRTGRIVTTTDLATWTVQTSNTTSMLNSVTCLSTSFCMAVGQGGTVDVYNGTTWTATTGNGGTGMLASVSCLDSSTCYATGKQGVTIATTDGGAHWATQAGGGTTQQMNGVSCPSASTCFVAGAAGTILSTTNGGQTWTAQTSGTTSALNGIACTSATACVAVGAAGTARVTTDGSTWGAGTTGTTQALNGVSCPSASCVAVGGAGTAITSADGGATWSAGTSGTTAALNAVTCPTASTCYAGGAASGGSATLLKSTNGGATFAAQTSGVPASLNGIACANASACFADGTLGTVITTTDGATWAQQGNPLSGPTSALNATGLTLNGSLCSASRCLFGAGAQGDVLQTPLVTVSVNATSVYGQPINLSGLSPSDPAVSISPASQAANVTGTLTCSTTATGSSDAGTYPVSSCSGLSDDGFSVVYDYAGSSYVISQASQTISFAPIADRSMADGDFTLSATASSGLPVSYTASGTGCTVSGDTVHVVHATSCTITAHQPGNVNYTAADDVSRSFNISKGQQSISFPAIGKKTLGTPDFETGASVSSGLPLSYATTGPCTIVDGHLVHLTGTGTCKITASQPGTADWNAAAPVTQRFKVIAAPVTATTTTLTGPATATPGQSITITATVDSSTGAPTSGSVQFVTTAGTVLGEVPLSGGSASLTFDAPSSNTTLKLKANYVPVDGNGWKPSSSTKLVIKVHS
jgi:photosystem II stability/assembly factor-like uncharacterized protein